MGKRAIRGGPWNPDRATQLLTEIRDLQRESLAITRDAVARQRRLARFAMGGIAFMLLLLALFVANLIYVILSSPPPGPRTTAPSTAGTMP